MTPLYFFLGLIAVVYAMVQPGRAVIAGIAAASFVAWQRGMSGQTYAGIFAAAIFIYGLLTNLFGAGSYGSRSFDVADQELQRQQDDYHRRQREDQFR